MCIRDRLLAASYEPIVVSEKRKISDMEKKLYDRQKPSSDMITARPGEAKKQNKLVDKYSKKYKTPKQKNETQQFLKGIARGEVHQEGSLHKWFSGSKSKDGKGGWVNVVTGGTCASDEPGEGTPKCVSSSKRASMSKSERLSAARRKKKADPGQQSKSGAAKPTYVSTDSPRKKKKMKEEIELTEVKDKKGKGSGSKDACYHKVKSRYSVWPSAYASGALVKCRKVGAANWGNSKKEEFDPSELSFQQFMEKCWKGYEKKGMKTMFGKRYPNCVKKEETVIEHHQKDKNGNTIPHEDTTPSSVEEGAAWTKKSGKNPSGGLNEKGRKSYERENPGSDLKRPSKKVGNKRRASFCARMRGMKKKLTSAKTARDPDSRINKSLRAWNC